MDTTVDVNGANNSALMATMMATAADCGEAARVRLDIMTTEVRELDGTWFAAHPDRHFRVREILGLEKGVLNLAMFDLDDLPWSCSSRPVLMVYRRQSDEGALVWATDWPTELLGHITDEMCMDILWKTLRRQDTLYHLTGRPFDETELG